MAAQEEEEEVVGDESSQQTRTSTTTNTLTTATHLHDLPDAVLEAAFAVVADVRTRNSMSLVCRRWRLLERATRTALSLRGSVRHLFLLPPPSSFPAVAALDLSLLSPWGFAFSPDDANHLLLARRLALSFPALSSLSLYSRHPSSLHALLPLLLTLPTLRHVSLVRWHPRPHLPAGSDLLPLLSACPALASLDLSRFYCWPEDVPAALRAHPASAASLRSLNLLCPSSFEGLRSSELIDISAACPNLNSLLALAAFDPRCLDFVGGETLVSLAEHCPQLSVLHLAHPSALSRNTEASDDEARITCAQLEALFAALPRLENLRLDLCHAVRDVGPALELLSRKCPRISSVKLGKFDGICRAAGLHLDGIAVCGGLRSLSIKNSEDLTDAGLLTIARGCRRLSTLEIHGCGKVTEGGVRRMAGMLRSKLVDISISGCLQLDAGASLRALAPVRDRIERLHIDCIWMRPGIEHLEGDGSGGIAVDFDADEFEQEDGLGDGASTTASKKCRYSDDFDNYQDYGNGNGNGLWCRNWGRLRHLSLWIPAGELLSPLLDAGLESCPELEEISIKVEGDCRTCPRPRLTQVFGLSSLALYPSLSKMKLDCGDAIGYALTAPTGQMDLSLWERFYLHGIGDLLLLNELDYWPPQDREVNHRSLSLPAAGLIQGCAALRKLFIHGTTHEHFLRFFLEMPNLRDVQLREDYYPAPENDMSTEMRVDSCSRFEDALNSRIILD